jgi:hypothetical protein
MLFERYGPQRQGKIARALFPRRAARFVSPLTGLRPGILRDTPLDVIQVAVTRQLIGDRGAPVDEFRLPNRY